MVGAPDIPDARVVDCPRHGFANHDFVARISQEGIKLFIIHQIHLHDRDLQDLADDGNLAALSNPIQGLLNARPNPVAQLFLGDQFPLQRRLG
ncbi:hypothetical protein [Pseudomonas syringae pv. coryli]|uniref:hypothetical protein n=1 Tax=Pseudomonas syringae pv. coryli TaxID=317659 RepID=UPI00138ED377|nr:hypothetical protein [Pseudomonas syringae pv. coryli]